MGPAERQPVTGDRFQRCEELFHSARQLDGQAREAFLREACAGDQTLLADVERLLAADDRAGDFIVSPAVAPPSAWADAAESWAGRRVGPYNVVREIGRGGMGAVYLAERADGQYRQRVALKLIKRGMDTEQVLARFRAERQILASLDHPNIARLVDGGSTTEGLPYLVMEYIDGQPIDAFADERRLMVADRLRLFLQVCDAVSYAHGQGVIHRDIKPLNILVTPSGVPKLLDFGIAKVMGEAADEVTSTVTGLRLLTPEYASPEQIEGRHATAASDVYALGVVLYELLTGRSPYRLASRAPQDVAAAVCTTEPDRPSAAVTRAQPNPGGTGRRRRHEAADHAAFAGAISARQLSRQLRGDLDTIVLVALRKEPGRRYASVAAFADDLRRHLGGQPVLARTDGAPYRVGKFVRRNRAGVAAGIAMLAAVGVAAVEWPRDGTEAVGPTLLSSQALARRDRILVADFTDRTGDSVLAAVVSEAVRTDLAQSAVVRVLTARQVRSTLELMRRPADVVLDDTLAREVALREGVKAFVTGSLARLSGAYIVTIQLVGAQDGEALAAVRETARDSTQLIPAVDRASKTLRRKIGESLGEMQETLPLDQATTASLPALRAYTEGMRAFRAGRRTEGIKYLEAAVALDTGFAAAHQSLGMVHGAMGNPGRAFEAGRHVLANQHRLTFLERSFYLAGNAYGRADYETAIEIYRKVIERFPDHMAALNNLALAYRDNRQYPEAEEMFHRAIQSDSTVANMYFGLHTVALLQGRFAQARAIMDTVTRRFPGHPILLTEEIQDAAAAQDWDRTERQARAQIVEAGADTLRAVDPVEVLAGVAMTRGRLAEAERRWQTQLAYTRAAGVMSRHLFGVIQLGYLELRHHHDPVRARRVVDSATAALSLASLLPGDRRYDELARFYAAAGDRPRAHDMLAAAYADDSILGRDLKAERSWTRGVLALAEGRAAQAVTELRQAAELHACEICPLPDLGRALEAVGERREAVKVYEHYVSGSWIWRYEPDAVELGWTLHRAGELHEELGERQKARTAYSRLVELWARADPPLQAVVADARSRRAALAGEVAGE
jgi:serine/threonine protein kinase/tetratricopeptide (TPR) repeat protein